MNCNIYIYIHCIVSSEFNLIQSRNFLQSFLSSFYSLFHSSLFFSYPIPNEAGTPIGLRKFPFWVFLSLNSLTFMLSYSTILLLIPSQDIYRIVRLSLISLSVCYMVSLTVIISTRLWETFWYVFICLLLCIFLLNASATCVAWSYKACL